MTKPVEMNAMTAPTVPVEAAANEAARMYDQDTRGRLAAGVGVVVTGLAAATAITYAYANSLNEKVTHALPFVPAAQELINDVDDALAVTGAVALPTALMAIGAVKIGAAVSPRLRAYDRWSSQELSEDAVARPTLMRRALRKVAAGSIPTIAAAGVALGTFTAGISEEVTEGPTRAIEAIDTLTPGESMVVQYRGAMPMVESNVASPLVASVRKEANLRGVPSRILELNLGTYTYGNQSRDDLTIATDVPASSNLHWTTTEGCTDVPILIDDASGIAAGERIVMNGVDARVVGTTEGASAINRIGIVMSREALRACIEQDGESPSHAVVLETEPATANDILAVANQELAAPATVITKTDYENNSRKFWEANVQPITNVLAVASGALTLLAMAGAMGGRLLRNRREWAAKLASGLSAGQLRATETLRSVKDGVLATVLGTSAAVAVTPAANMLESGFRAGIGVREALVGAGLGVVGAVAGGVSKLLRLKKTVDAAKHTRV
ncbi:MAG TPA: hypothetical protein VD735_06815 [Candidatus Saccharimonadales bacterium]|nr:hypothetical protein [Candidatus Saccharimonadales bacterium]